jgi:excinuclease ABC subunit A
MQFLADVFVPCDQCDGKRFKPKVLEVRYKGRNIHQVLDLTVREALTFFSSSPKVLRRLQVLDESGLGYLRLGQPATTLSGGEAQRIKIAAHLSSHAGDRLLSFLMNRPQACTSTTSPSCSPRFETARSRQRWSSSSTTWT